MIYDITLSLKLACTFYCKYQIGFVVAFDCVDKLLKNIYLISVDARQYCA